MYHNTMVKPEISRELITLVRNIVKYNKMSVDNHAMAKQEEIYDIFSKEWQTM